MKFKCKYCKIVFNCSTFEEIEKHKKTQCFITRKGVTHDLKAIFGEN